MKKIIAWFLLLGDMSVSALAAARIDEAATASDLLRDVPF